MYKKAPEHILALVKETIVRHHNRLRTANIAVLMKDKATQKNGVYVLGTAAVFPDKMKPLTNINYDFLVVLAEDTWIQLTPSEREALVDHELCHCEYDENSKPVVRAHDVEEFVEIIERHGFWRPSLRSMALAVQTRFEFGDTELGHVGSLDVSVEYAKVTEV